MKSLRKLFLGSILCLALVIGTAAPMRNVEAEDKGYVTKQYSAETDIVKENGVPVYTDEDGTVDDNYLFAGWYSDADCTTSLKAFAADCYAKFVDREVLTVALQLQADTTSATEESAIKFLTSVDSTNYKKVGFTVDIEKNGTSVFDNAQDVPTMTVYETLTGYVDEQGTDYKASDIFATASNYFAGYEFTDVTNTGVTYADANQFAWTFVITPYWTTYDDVTVNGLTKTFEVNDFLYEAEVDELNTWYPTLEGALDAAQTDNAASSVTILSDVEINGTLAVTQTLTLQSREGVDLTITRGAEAEDDYTYNMLQNKTTNANDVVSIQAGIDAYGNGSLTFDSFSRMVDKVVDEEAETTEKVQESLVCNVIRNDDDDTKENATTNTIGTLKIGKQVRIINHMAGHASTGQSSAIHNEGTAILNCDFINNDFTSKEYNAPIHNSDSATLTIESGTYSNNKGGQKYSAGVIYNNRSGIVFITGGTFYKNSCTGTDASTAGVICSRSDGQITIDGGEFIENSAYKTGVINNINENTSTKKMAILTINNGKFVGNYATDNNTDSNTRGGVIFNQGSEVTITGGQFDSNHSGRGGVVYNGAANNTASTLTITGGSFTNNYATLNGGGVVENNGSNLTIAGTSTSTVTMTGNYWKGKVSGGNGGGAILHSNGAKKLEISGCNISNNNGVGKDGATLVADINVASAGTACSSVTFKDNTFTGIIQVNTGSYDSTTKPIIIPNGDGTKEFVRTTDYTNGTAYRIDWSALALTAVDLSTLSN